MYCTNWKLKAGLVGI